MKRIRVVQVGTWLYTHSDHVMMSLRSMPHIYEVVGVCEPNEDYRKIAEDRAAYQDLKWFSLDEVLNDTSLDAVIIETHELEQGKYALMFAERGFNIHLEKPGASNVKEFEKLTDLANRNHTILQLGYMYRYNPAVQRALENIRSGKIGELIATEAQMSHRYGNDDLRTALGEYPGGMMYYLGCHLVDLLYEIMGEPAKVIPMNRASGIEGTGELDSGLVLYEYPHGVSMLKTVATEVDGAMRRYLMISGTRGTIEISPIEYPVAAAPITNANTVTVTTKYYPETHPDKMCTEALTLCPYGRYDDMMLEFAKYVCGDKPNPYTPDRELAAFRLLMRSV